MGRDIKQDFWKNRKLKFQSTLPAWGETRRKRPSTQRKPNFNPLSPHGERLIAGAPESCGSAFQSTLPAWGETNGGQSWREDRDHFNPLSPHGERRAALPHPKRGKAFQSTLPAWGETQARDRHQAGDAISIHSPRMGRDGILRFLRRRIQRFQSTLPAWGETGRSAGRARKKKHFNPLSPHGERQQTHTTFRREKLAHLHNIVSFRQQRGSSC